MISELAVTMVMKDNLSSSQFNAATISILHDAAYHANMHGTKSLLIFHSVASQLWTSV